MTSVRTCAGCRFCCWSFAINDIPDQTLGLQQKPSLTHCQHECGSGCTLHGAPEKPATCRQFECPYLLGNDIHRPDAFRPALDETKCRIGNFIPAISSRIPVERAAALIDATDSIPASIMICGKWTKVIMPMRKESNGTWQTHALEDWRALYSEFGAGFDESFTENAAVTMV